MLSAMPAALISGFRSYVGTFGDGTRMRSSPPNGFSNATVEEIRDVGVLLGFRAAEDFQIMFGKNLREDVRKSFRAQST